MAFRGKQFDPNWRNLYRVFYHQHTLKHTRTPLHTHTHTQTHVPSRCIYHPLHSHNRHTIHKNTQHSTLYTGTQPTTAPYSTVMALLHSYIQCWCQNTHLPYVTGTALGVYGGVEMEITWPPYRCVVIEVTDIYAPYSLNRNFLNIVCLLVNLTLFYSE